MGDIRSTAAVGCSWWSEVPLPDTTGWMRHPAVPLPAKTRHRVIPTS